MADAIAIRPLAAMDRTALLTLNNDHATELSWLPAERLAQMLEQAFYARGVGDALAAPVAAPLAALIAFDQDSAYAGRHFAWFRARYQRFVYIDRVVVAPTARGRGLARALYADLFTAARTAGQAMVACEVNYRPPNPASQRFHAGLGFTAVGQTTGEEKDVIYFTRHLDGGE